MQNLLSVDIVIPIYKNIEISLDCIKSIFLNTDFISLDVKLVIINDTGDDNFSKILDRTLNTFFKNDLDKYICIHHSVNKGFIEACYSGIEIRKTDYKVLLNSDTIVTKNWLNSMVEMAEKNDEIAMVNPLSNCAPIIDADMPVGFNINLMNKFCADFIYDSNDNIDVVTAVGFCLLIKTKYIELYGFFDRIYENGYCEETDLYFRFLTQGLRAVIDVNSFVYHRGETSFVDRDERILKNQDIFWTRYRHVYDAIISRFNETSILNTLREKLNQISAFNVDVCIFSPDSNLTSGGIRVLHNTANILNLNGISTSYVTLYNHQYNNSTYKGLTLYKPISFIELKNLCIKPKVILYSFWKNYDEAFEYACFIQEKFGYMPKIVNVLQGIEGWFPQNNIDNWRDDLDSINNYYAVSDFVAKYVNQNILKCKAVSIVPNTFDLTYLEKLILSNCTRSTDLIAMSRDDLFRGKNELLRILKDLDLKSVGKNLVVKTFGDYELKEKFKNIKYQHLGVLSPEELEHEFLCSKVFLETSYYQGFGLCLFEAMFLGCKIISSSNNGAYTALNLLNSNCKDINFYNISEPQEVYNILEKTLDSDVDIDVIIDNALNASHFALSSPLVKYFKDLLETNLEFSDSMKILFYNSNKRLKDKVINLKQQIEYLNQTISCFENSTSWRFTKILRIFMSKIKGMK